MIDQSTADVIAGISLLASGADLYQSTKIADNEKKRSILLHSESLDKATELHEENLRIIKQAYLIESYTSLEQHFQQLNADLSHNAKESERDMFDQRNQQYQTIILSSSVMFAALSTTIIQGILPSGSSSFICIAYAITTSLSFAFLFLCIVLCIEIVSRASQFMYKRSIKHTDNLKKAIETTENAITNMRHNQEKSKKEKRNEDYVKDRWNQHEIEMHKMMAERENINREVAYFHEQKEVSEMQKPFEDFWNKSCKRWGRIAILFFYAGTYNLLLAIMLLMWSYFYIIYESIAGAIIAISCIGSSLFLGAIMLVLFKENNSKKFGKLLQFRFPVWPLNFPHSNDKKILRRNDSIESAISDLNDDIKIHHSIDVNEDNFII